MAKRYGFKCTVLFGLDKKGHIKTGSNNIPGIEALDNADMLFLGVRFLTPNDQWMEHFENYLNAGKPVLGLRTQLMPLVISKASIKNITTILLVKILLVASGDRF